MTMTAEEAYETFKNSAVDRIIHKTALENIIKTCPQYAYLYAGHMVKGRWFEGEEIIKSNTTCAVNYARDIIGGRWLEAENIIKNNAENAYRYAYEVVKRLTGERWIEGEDVIKTDPYYACLYAKNVIGGRWETLERYLIEKKISIPRYGWWSLTQIRYWQGYGIDFLNVFPFDEARVIGGELPKHLQEAIECYYHAKDVIKGRWIEAEDIIKQFDTAWSMYQEFLDTLPLTDDQDEIVNNLPNNLPPVDVNKIQIELEALKAKVRELEYKLCEVV